VDGTAPRQHLQLRCPTKKITFYFPNRWHCAEHTLVRAICISPDSAAKPGQGPGTKKTRCVARSVPRAALHRIWSQVNLRGKVEASPKVRDSVFSSQVCVWYTALYYMLYVLESRHVSCCAPCPRSNDSPRSFPRLGAAKQTCVCPTTM